MRQLGRSVIGAPAKSRFSAPPAPLPDFGIGVAPHGREKESVGDSWRLQMSRRLFVATTVAVVCSVGSIAIARQVEPNGATSSSPGYQISAEAVQLFSPNRDFGHEYAVLSEPIDIPFSPDMSIVMADLRPPTHQPVTTTPQAQTQDQSQAQASGAEYPLVPLPPSVWTGSAGLLGLGLMAFYRKLRKDFL